mgnify:CR=1 FL=1
MSAQAALSTVPDSGILHEFGVFDREGKMAQAAIREASMLIERNEPHGVGCWYDHTPHGHGLRETRTALAEALATFVVADIA